MRHLLQRFIKENKALKQETKIRTTIDANLQKNAARILQQHQSVLKAMVSTTPVPLVLM